MTEHDIAVLLSGEQMVIMTDEDHECNTILDKAEIHEFIDRQKKFEIVLLFLYKSLVQYLCIVQKKWYF